MNGGEPFMMMATPEPLVARSPDHDVEQAWRAYNRGVMPPARNELDLFKPGPGGLPPYLAGREREQQICRAFLDRLQQGAAPPRDLILYGPRGKRQDDAALLAARGRSARAMRST